MNLSTIYLILILLSLQNRISNQKDEKVQIPFVNIIECSHKKVLKLSDITSKSRLVKLETNDSCFIGRDSRYIAGSKYIICITRSNLLQFNSNGGFIRNLAQSGRGPEEFVNITGVDIDPQEKNLFFTSSNSKMIHVVDLNTGKFNNPIPLSKGGLSSKIVVQNDRIAILPSISNGDSFLLYYQDLFGKFIEGIPITYKKIPQLKIRTDKNPMSLEGKIYFYESTVCGDTVFEISRTNKTPVMIVYGGEDFGISNNNPTGYIHQLLSKTINSWLFSNQLLEMSNNALTIRDVHYYFVENTDFQLSEITEFTLDNLGKTYSPDELKKGLFTTASSFDLARKQFILRIEAIEFKKIVAANKMKVPENELIQIKKLDKEISIYDNPVLLIGQLK